MKLDRHLDALRACRRCAQMSPPVVVGAPVLSSLLLVGQAPGAKEGTMGRPFAWTAGKTLFRWLTRIGCEESFFRARVYLAAVCRCFPGKNAEGGDRVPSPDEIQNCRPWLEAEIDILRPELVIAVGRLAARQFLDFDRLEAVVGPIHPGRLERHHFDVVVLPHPSGASTWHRREPGLTLMGRALASIQQHRAFQRLLDTKALVKH